MRLSMANIDDKKIPKGTTETPIVGRLHDVSEDHVVTGANEVFDDAFGERQSQINDKLRHYTKMAHIRIDAEEITREHNDNLLNEQINAKQLEIGAVETDTEPILESPNMLPSGAVAFNLGYYESNPEWVRVILDGAKRVLAGIKKDGSVEWMVGVPTPIKKYIEGQVSDILEYIQKKIDENILAVEFEENGDIAAYYGEEGNINDVYTDENGDIIVEQNITVN